MGRLEYDREMMAWKNEIKTGVVRLTSCMSMIKKMRTRKNNNLIYTVYLWTEQWNEKKLAEQKVNKPKYDLDQMFLTDLAI